jgi:hypothetical protein
MKRLIPLLLLFVSTVSLAESGEYLVEVIVFRHLEAAASPVASGELRKFSQYPDLIKAPDDLVATAEPAETVYSAEETPAPPGEAPPGLPQPPPADLPDDLVVMDGRSAYMDDVWRRLRASKAYRPLLFSAWKQNRVDYYPPMRLHDGTMIDRQLRPPTAMVFADLTAEDPLDRYRSDFYRVDGTVQLRRSRFLHLYLDLVYRQTPSAEEDVTDLQEPLSPASGQPGKFELTPPGGAVNQVYTLKQNRQIRTGSLQYFDTPYLGALVFVTARAAE